ncbi:MAG: DUF2779 domain-containing protein [Hyphomonadaceae bacterium]
MTTPGLSKSRITSFEQCPKKLWLSVRRPELRQEDPTSLIRLAMGNELGALARTLAPGGVLVEAEPDLKAALRQTAALLAGGHAGPIYEATFAHDGVLVQADIIEPTSEGQWALAEVKSTTSVRDYHSGDVATQVWVMRNAGLSIASAAVRHVDTAFVLNTPGDYRGLLVDQRLDDLEPIIKDRPAVVAGAREALTGAEPQREMGRHCRKPFPCEFQAYCGRNQPLATEWPIDLMPKTGKKIAAQWAIDGVHDLRDLPEDALESEQHRRIHRATITGNAFHDRAGVEQATASWNFPRHYLDFETIAPPIPRWLGTRPYQHVPFQFSCHTETEDGNISHTEYLSIGGDDPRRGLALGLVACLWEGDAREGAIITYNAHFERACIRHLADALPDLSEQLLEIAGRIVDLLPVTRQNFYHRDQRGSWSIKNVIAAVAPELDYAGLEVGDGQSAQYAWTEATGPTTNPDRREAIRNVLQEYCRRDTWAMVILLRRLLSAD